MLFECTVLCTSAYFVPQYVPYFVSLCITCPVGLVCVKKIKKRRNTCSHIIYDFYVPRD